MADTVQEIAFRYAVDRVNSNRDVLPRSRLTAQIERIPQQDSFYASKQGIIENSLFSAIVFYSFLILAEWASLG